MRVRTGALIATAVVLGGATAGAATAAGPPPPRAANGATVNLVASGLTTPTSFAFGQGKVFEGDGGSTSSAPPNGGVFLLQNGTEKKLAGSPQFVAGMEWYRGALYLSGGYISKTGAKWQLLKWNGWNGTTFAKRQAIYTAPKRFDGFNGLAFGPDGRLYIGVDTGLTDNNDHGPAFTSPYLYEILSIKPNGKGLRVFAMGIRQPWQLAFRGRSSVPYVSDLGQDSGAKNPPDFLLRVRRGDNYGFPFCNWTRQSGCTGYTKPFRFFAPHTDLMGLAIIGNRLYTSSFMGRGGKGPGGEVLSMSLRGKDVKPVVTGFVAPVVGLGQHDGSLYVGELTGQVWSVKP